MRIRPPSARRPAALAAITADSQTGNPLADALLRSAVVAGGAPDRIAPVDDVNRSSGQTVPSGDDGMDHRCIRIQPPVVGERCTLGHHDQQSPRVDGRPAEETRNAAQIGRCSDQRDPDRPPGFAGGPASASRPASGGETLVVRGCSSSRKAQESAEET